MKRTLAIGLAVLCLLVGCTGRMEPPAAPKTEPFSYSSKVFYFVEDGGILAVDMEGRIIDVDNPQNISLPEGSQAEDVQIQVAADGSATLTLDYPYSFAYTQPVYADSQDAPEAFAQAALEEMLGNAIWDYTLKDVQIVEQREGRIDFLMHYDLRLARNATNFEGYSPFDEPYGAHTVLTEQKRAVTILGTGKQWLSKEPINFGDRKGAVVAAYDDFVAEAGQEVIFATAQAVYYMEKIFLPQSAEDRDNGGQVEYETTLWAMDRQSGQRRLILDAGRNHEFHFQDYAGDKIYLTAYAWEPYSESFPAGLYVIDDKSGAVRQLQDSAMAVAMTEDAIYTIDNHFEDGQWAMALYAINQSTAHVQKVCVLPEQGHDLRRFMVKGDEMRLYQYDWDNHCRIIEINLADGTYQ